MPKIQPQNNPTNNYSISYQLDDDILTWTITLRCKKINCDNEVIKIDKIEDKYLSKFLSLLIRSTFCDECK